MTDGAPPADHRSRAVRANGPQPVALKRKALESYMITGAVLFAVVIDSLARRQRAQAGRR